MKRLPKQGPLLAVEFPVASVGMFPAMWYHGEGRMSWVTRCGDSLVRQTCSKIPTIGCLSQYIEEYLHPYVFVLQQSVTQAETTTHLAIAIICPEYEIVLDVIGLVMFRDVWPFAGESQAERIGYLIEELFTDCYHGMDFIDASEWLTLVVPVMDPVF